MDATQALIDSGADPDLVQRVMRDIRTRWAGTECYIQVIDRHARDAEIQRALKSGLPTREAAKKVGCSQATIRRRRSEWL